MATLLTDWAGPRAFLSELYCEVRRFNVSGNVTQCIGRIQSKSQDEGCGRVRVELEAIDLNGHVTASGWAKLRFDLCACAQRG